MNRNGANKGYTEIMIVADRSGSMRKTIYEARNSINTLIEEQKKLKDEAYFSFAMFDDVYTRNVESINIKHVNKIGEEYSARGMTALFDSIGKSINYLEDRINKNSTKPDNVIVCIITDGYENSSQEFTKEQISDMVDKKKKEGWVFKFIGANIDAFATGAQMGFSREETIQYSATNEGTRSMYGTLSSNISTIRGNTNGN